MDILSLLPLTDAARAGCVSQTFWSSWRCHPHLTLNRETLGLIGNACGRDELGRIFTNRVEHIMKKHLGGVKAFKLRYCGSFFNKSYLNRFNYDFPCSVLLNGSGKSIRHLYLNRCAFHPTAGLGCLTRLQLYQVHITGDELGHLLSNSLAMEDLNLNRCDNIICLKIPSLLHRFNCLTVLCCIALEVIENKAPNVCIVYIDSALEKPPVGDLLQVKELHMLDVDESNLVHYACSKLPFIMPNLEFLSYVRQKRDGGLFPSL
ncbi:hypothetical protein VPH35_083875 [Triticum aestivum]